MRSWARSGVATKMHLTVQNYRQIAHADLQISNKITLIAGKNGAGKTSILESLASTLSGQIDGAIKDAGELVRVGNQNARATLAQEGAFRSATWGAKGSFKVEGQGLRASTFCTGQADFLSLKPAERVNELKNLLELTPTFEELKAEMLKLNFEEGAVSYTWTQIQSLGWDGVYQAVKTKGTQLKGQWEGITGWNFGTDNLKKYKPEHWDESFPLLEEDDLISLQAQAAKTYDALIAEAALDKSEREKLEDQVAALPILLQETARLGAIRDAEMKKWEEKTAENKAHDWKHTFEKPYNCPACGAAVILRNETLTIPGGNGPTPAEHSEAKKRGFELQTEVSRARTAYEGAERDYQAAHALSSAAHSAKLSIELDVNKRNVSAEELDKARISCELTRARLQSFKQWQKANAVAKEIAQNLSLQALLAPAGLQAAKLRQVLEQVNKELREYSRIAGWQPVEMTEDLNLTSGGFKYRRVAGNEKFKIRAILAIFFASRDGSDLIILDGADILGRDNMRGLAQLAGSVDLPVLIGMKADSPREVPDLQADGRGVTYWIANHTAMPISEIAAGV